MKAGAEDVLGSKKSHQNAVILVVVLESTVSTDRRYSLHT